MRAVRALVVRELRLALRGGGGTLTLVLFFLAIGVVVPIAVGPDRELLALLAPGMVWVAALLSLLLGLDRLFRDDHEDGSLVLFGHAVLALEAVVAARLFAHWLVTALPLIAVTPLFALLFAMDGETLGRTLVSLAIGTPALVALGGVGAAATVTLRRGGVLAPVLILPLSLPVVIFGVGAVASPASASALLFLSGLGLLAIVFAPFAAALALRLGAD